VVFIEIKGRDSFKRYDALAAGRISYAKVQVALGAIACVDGARLGILTGSAGRDAGPSLGNAQPSLPHRWHRRVLASGECHGLTAAHISPDIQP